MIVYRLVKGSPLTIAEFDGNFHDVDDRITAIEDNPAEARSIDEITAVGNTLVILYTDSTEDTVPMPVLSLSGKGNWTPFTAYLPNDIVTANGTIYLVLFAHTSAATFDPGANDGLGHDYYAELFPIPELQIPAGGGEGYVLSKVSDSDYDIEWQARGIPAGGSAGEVLTKISGDDFDVEFSAASFVPTVVTVIGSTFEPSSLADAECYYRCVNPSGCVVTIPADSSVPFPIGSELHFRQCGPGPVVINGQDDSDGEALVDAGSDFDTVTDGSGSVLTVKKVGTDSWDVFGRLLALSV